MMQARLGVQMAFVQKALSKVTPSAASVSMVGVGFNALGALGAECVACPVGTTNAVGDDSSGVDTTCDAAAAVNCVETGNTAADCLDSCAVVAAVHSRPKASLAS